MKMLTLLLLTVLTLNTNAKIWRVNGQVLKIMLSRFPGE
jgi:hypothetical protein